MSDFDLAPGLHLRHSSTNVCLLQIDCTRTCSSKDNHLLVSAGTSECALVIQNVHLFLYYIEDETKSHFEVVSPMSYAILGKEFFYL